MPNPIMGFEVDTFGTTGGAGYPGGYMEQLIKTAGKLHCSGWSPPWTCATPRSP